MQVYAKTAPEGALVMIDLDKFKSVNDEYGHAAGDEVLKTAASKLVETFRDTDSVGRLGGEEFVVFAPRSRAAQVLKRLNGNNPDARHATMGIDFDFNDPNRRGVTFSGGIVNLRKGETIEKGLERADKILYRMKEAGRNRIEAETLEEDIEQV